jgi:hypothetical protein
MIQVVRRSIVDTYNQYQFNRPSLAYDSKGKLYHVHNARFESGKFGQAIMLEEGTTNIGSPASLFDSSWTLATGTSTVIDAYTRKYTFGSNLSGAFAYKTFTLTTGVAYTWSAEIKGEGGTVGKQVRLQSAAEPAYGTPVTLTTEWQRVTLTFTATDTSRAVGFIGVPYNTFVPGDVVYVRFFQLEAKPYATSFIDGTRAAETLTIPTAGVLNENEFDITGWFIPAASSSVVPAWARIWALKGVSLTGLFINGSVICFAWNNKQIIKTNISLSANDQLFYSVSKSGSNVVIRLAKNGGALSTFTGTTDETTLGATEISLGSSGTEGSFYNGKHDDLRISNIARSDEEIPTAYQSNQPLPVDGGTTLKLNFDGPDAQRAAKVLAV